MGDRSIAPCYRVRCGGARRPRYAGCVVRLGGLAMPAVWSDTRTVIDSAPAHCCVKSWTRSEQPQITSTENAASRSNLGGSDASVAPEAPDHFGALASADGGRFGPPGPGDHRRDIAGRATLARQPGGADVVACARSLSGSRFRSAGPAIGISTSMTVPLPVWLSIRILPPSASIRSLSPVSPDPRLGSAPPTPSSRIERRSKSSSILRETHTRVAFACFDALVSASETV